MNLLKNSTTIKMIRNKCQKIRRGRKFQSTSSLWGEKKGTFGGPVEHVYIDTRLRDVREAHKRGRKRKSPTVKKKKKIGTWEGRKKCTN